MAISLLYVMGRDAYQAHAGSAGNIKELAIALAAVLDAGMAGIGLKGKTEPGGDQ